MKQITPFLLLTALLGSLTLAQAEALLFVSDGSTLSSLNPTNAAILSTQTLSSSGLRAMTFSSTGILYGLFTQDLDARLAVIDPTSGNVSFLAFSTGLFVPSGLAFDSTGSLYGLFDDQIYGAERQHWRCGQFALRLQYHRPVFGIRSRT